MDIDLARTFLEIVRCGSFIAASERLHLTQTAVTARMHSLENQLGCRLFIRNRAGARPTEDGERFVRYASQLLQTWEAARRDLPLPQGYDDVLRLGAETSLCNPLLLIWLQRLRQHLPEHALSAQVGEGPGLQEQLERGLLDAVLVYQPEYRPGLLVEQVLEEKLVQVARVGNRQPYLYVDWGPVFRQQHDTALPEHARAPLTFNLGPLALQYLLQYGGHGYFRTRVVQRYLDQGLLERVPRAPEFTYPVYLVHLREHSNPACQQALQILREIAPQAYEWSRGYPDI